MYIYVFYLFIFAFIIFVALLLKQEHDISLLPIFTMVFGCSDVYMCRQRWWVVGGRWRVGGCGAGV